MTPRIVVKTPSDGVRLSREEARRRHETGSVFYSQGELDQLKLSLAEELADTLLYLDLLADHYDLDIESAIREKFNRVSEERGFPHKVADR